MSSQRQQHLKLEFPMMTTGVNTSLSRLVSPENTFFSTENAFVDLKGTMRKSQNRIAYGNRLFEPTKPLPSNGEEVSIPVLLDNSRWTIDNSGLDDGYIAITGQPDITAYCVQGTPGSATAVYPLLEGESYNDNGSYDGSFTYGFSLRGSSMSGETAYTGVGLYMVLAVEEDKGLQIAITGDRIWVYSGPGSWSSISLDEDLTDGNVHSIILYREAGSEDLIVSVDEHEYTYASIFGFGGTPSSAWETATNDNWVQITLANDASMEDISLSVFGIFLRDTGEDAYTTANIDDMQTVTRVIPESRRVEYNTYLLTHNYVWKTKDFSQIWSPLYKLGFDRGRLASFRGKTILFDFGNSLETDVVEISPTGDVRALDDCPPIRFGAEHLGRLWGAGDTRYPLRLYYSGLRDPSVWFAPDSDADGQETYEEIRNAGWIEIPGEAGERITALYGNFYSVLVVFTNKSAYILAGYNEATYRLSKLTDSVGAITPECVVKVNNDLLAVGENGIDYLKGSEQYGDVITAKVSGPIQDIFTITGDELRRINLEQAYEYASVAFHRQAGLLYFGYPTLQDVVCSEIMVFNLSTQQWYGPLKVDHTCLSNIATGWPVRESIAIGGTDGLIWYYGPFSEDEDEVVLETQYINGRGLDPQLAMMEKVFSSLRILYNPSGNYDMTIEWKVDGGRWQSRTVKLTPNHPDLIGDTFVLGASRLISSEEPAVVDIPVDARGKGIKFKLTTSAPMLSIVALNLDYTVSGYERE